MSTLADLGIALGGAAAVGQLLAPGTGEGPDRDYWGRYWREYQYRQEGRSREDTVIQRRVADAARAGVHPLFALGASSASGGGSVSMPSADFYPDGQDRWSGLQSVAAQLAATRRQKPVKADRRMEYLQEQAVRAEIQRTQAETMRTAVEARAVLNAQPGLTGTSSVPNLYVKVWDNLNKRYIWLPNSELGVEMPEGIGAYYWGRGKQHDPDVKKQRELFREQNPPDVLF